MHHFSVEKASLILLGRLMFFAFALSAVGCENGDTESTSLATDPVEEYSAAIVLDWREDDAMSLVSNQQLRVSPPDDGYVTSLINEARRIDHKGISFDMERITASFRNGQPTWVRFIIRCREVDKELILESCHAAVNLMQQAELSELKKLEIYASARTTTLSSQLEKLYTELDMVHHSFDTHGLTIGCKNGEILKVVETLSTQRAVIEKQVQLRILELKKQERDGDELQQAQRQLKVSQLNELRHQLEMKTLDIEYMKQVGLNLKEVSKKSYSVIETKSLVSKESEHWWRLHGDLKFIIGSGGRFNWKVKSELNHPSDVPSSI